MKASMTTKSPRTTKPEDVLLQAWKRQADAGLRLLEAMVEGSTRMREIQLEAAAQAHADAEATRKALAAASDLPQILKLQTQWAQANAGKCLAYWRSVFQSVMETDAALVKCMYAEAAVPLPGAAQRFYKPLEKAAA